MIFADIFKRPWTEEEIFEEISHGGDVAVFLREILVAINKIVPTIQANSIIVSRQYLFKNNGAEATIQNCLLFSKLRHLNLHQAMTIGDKSDPFKEFFMMPRHLFDSLENEFFQLSFKYEYHLDIGGPEYAYAVWYLEEHMSALWRCSTTGSVSTLGDYLKKQQMVEVISNRAGGWIEIGEKIHKKGIQHIDLYKKLD